jgi:Winged helix-turn helix
MREESVHATPGAPLRGGSNPHPGIQRPGNPQSPGGRPKAGRTPTLTKAEQALLDAVFRGPDRAEDGGSDWTLPMLCRWIERRFDMRLHPASLSRVLRRLDLSRQKTRPLHPIADDKAKAAFAKRVAGCADGGGRGELGQAHRVVVNGRSPHRPEGPDSERGLGRQLGTSQRLLSVRDCQKPTVHFRPETDRPLSGLTGQKQTFAARPSRRRIQPRLCENTIALAWRARSHRKARASGMLIHSSPTRRNRIAGCRYGTVFSHSLRPPRSEEPKGVMSALGELGNDANRPTWARSRRSCDARVCPLLPTNRTSMGRTQRTEKGRGADLQLALSGRRDQFGPRCDRARLSTAAGACAPRSWLRGRARPRNHLPRRPAAPPSSLPRHPSARWARFGSACPSWWSSWRRR